MRDLSWERVSAKGREHPPYHEVDPPTPAQMFARLGLLLMVALGFGLAAELLPWLSQ